MARITRQAISLRHRQGDDYPAALAEEGAEIEQGVVAGMHTAFAGKAELSTDHVLAAVKASPPLSVTMAERIDALRRWAHERCVPAD